MAGVEIAITFRYLQEIWRPLTFKAIGSVAVDPAAVKSAWSWTSSALVT
jgi:hypothetical protein